MSSHFHLIIQTPDFPDNPADKNPSISNIMHDINSRFAHVYNKLHNRKGHFFNARFKSPIIEIDSYGIALIKYIAQNPVRAGMVKHPRDWRWSSYRVYSLGENDPLIDLIPSYVGMNAKRLVRMRMIRELVEGQIMKKDNYWSCSFAIGKENFIRNTILNFLGSSPPG